MEGLATASPHIGATASQGQQLGLTFTYTPADIQGLAEPAVRGGGTSVPRQHPSLHAAHGVQVQGLQAAQRPPGMVIAQPSQSLAPMSTSRQQGMPHTVHPYDTIEALIQQQERSSHLSHSQPHNQPHTQPHTPSHVQSVVPVNVRLPSTPDSPTKERPRIKGRMTPYAFFVQQRRDYYRQQGVPVQFTPFSKECSSLWKAMSDEEKQKYQKLAEEDRERYRREVTGFEKPLAKDGTRRGRRKKEPGQPKRNMCAFLHFCSVKRPKLKQENPSLSVGAMARQLSSAWKLMTPEQKKPYNEMAERDKQRYEQQKQAYEAGYSAAFLRRGDLSPSSLQAGTGASGASSGLMVGPIPPRHRRRKKDPDMPRRNMSAFMFYSLENRPNIKAQNPEFGVGKLAQRLAQHWKLMNTTQKHPYQLMARKDKERYESELKAYKKGMYTGSGLTARQVAHSVTGRTIPPPASHSNSSSSSRPTSQTSQMPPMASPVDEEGSPPSGDELDQLCEFYQ